MKCIICNKEFVGRSDAKFCSPKCRVKASRIEDPSLPTIEIEEHIETNAEKEFRQRMELRDIYLKYRFGANTSS